MNRHVHIPPIKDYRALFDKELELMGDLYTFDDIMNNISQSKMQSFSTGNTWAITEVHDYPNRRVLDIFIVVGDLEDTQELHDRIIKFASKIDASLVRAFGRVGWNKFAAANGWTSMGTTYFRNM